MTVTKLRGKLQDYFDHMCEKKIVGVGVFDGELVIVLDNGDEVCIFLDDNGDMAIQINPKPDLDS